MLFRSALQHGFSRLIGWLTRLEIKPLKNFAIEQFVKKYAVNTDEIQDFSPDLYPSFNAFFTRALKPTARSIDQHAKAIVSPADGFVSLCGPIESETLVQAKGKFYTVPALLGETQPLHLFENGSFLTAYLAPKNYHRVHLPIDGRLLRMRYIPGELFSVSQQAVATVDNLFARNERVVAFFETHAGLLAVVFVGATLVGSIETVWHGVVAPNKSKTVKTWDYTDKNFHFKKGQEIGRFNMGSTVILLFEKDKVTWNLAMTPDAPLQMGQKIGEIQ